MITKAVEDRNPKVFLTSLIVVDDVLHEMEKSGMEEGRCRGLLEGVVRTLVHKLSDRAQPKAVEGAFSMLVNFALSPSVGHVYMGNVAIRQLGEREAKAPKTVVGRMELLGKLVKEFGEEAVGGEKVLEFITGPANGYLNKSNEVRMAAKELTKKVYLHLGARVLPYLQGLSDRVRREMKTELSKCETHGEKVEGMAREAVGSGLPHFTKQTARKKEDKKESPRRGVAAQGGSGKGRGRGRGREGYFGGEE